MTFRRNWLSFILACLVLAVALVAHPPEACGQSEPAVALESPGSPAKTVVPRLIKFSGTLLDEQAQPMISPVGVTFALYAQQSGSAALWMETQNVETDAKGTYTVLLGANSANGVPVELFNAGEARWLGVQAEGQSEQPRVLLVSVPYALKAGDAQTLGGLPPSAFAPAGSVAPPSTPSTSLVVTSPSFAAGAAPGTGANSVALSATACTAITADGTATANLVAKFTGACTIHQSQLFDNGTNVGIANGSTAPAATLDVFGTGMFRGALTLPAINTANSTTKGFNSQPFDFLASVFNGAAAVSQHFRWQAEPVNPGLSTASGKLNLLFASGTGTLTETGLSITNKGLFTFATGQTFPGAGTITGITTASGSGLQGGLTAGNATLSLLKTCTSGQILAWNGTAWVCETVSGTGTITAVHAGTNLTGGGTAGSVTLNLDTTKVPQLAAANVFTGNQSVTGNVSVTKQLISTVATGTAPLSVNSTTQVANLNASLLGGLPAGAFALIGAPNVFTANQQTINGFLTVQAGISALGFNVPANSGLSGTDAIDATGGNADPNSFAPGGSGLVATGGVGGGAAGVGGTGVIGTGGPVAGPFFVGNAGNGVVGNGGSCTASSCRSGAGGVFTGGTGGINGGLGPPGGDGIDVTAGTSGIAGKFTGELDATAGTSGIAGKLAGELRVATSTAGGTEASFGGFGDFAIDAPGIVGGRFVVKDSSGFVGVGLAQGTNPSNIFTIEKGKGHAISDGWDTYSSQRWKTNIHPLLGALRKVQQLRGVSYDRQRDGKHEIGVIAEEVGKVVPEVVSYEENGVEAKGVDYARLTALLIEAMKEQQREIERQRERIQKLSRQVRVLSKARQAMQ